MLQISHPIGSFLRRRKKTSNDIPLLPLSRKDTEEIKKRPIATQDNSWYSRVKGYNPLQNRALKKGYYTLGAEEEGRKSQSSLSEWEFIYDKPFTQNNKSQASLSSVSTDDSLDTLASYGDDAYHEFHKKKKARHAEEELEVRRKYSAPGYQKFYEQKQRAFLEKLRTTHPERAQKIKENFNFLEQPFFQNIPYEVWRTKVRKRKSSSTRAPHYSETPSKQEIIEKTKEDYSTQLTLLDTHQRYVQAVLAHASNPPLNAGFMDTLKFYLRGRSLRGFYSAAETGLSKTSTGPGALMANLFSELIYGTKGRRYRVAQHLSEVQDQALNKRPQIFRDEVRTGLDPVIVQSVRTNPIVEVEYEGSFIKSDPLGDLLKRRAMYATAQEKAPPAKNDQAAMQALQKIRHQYPRNSEERKGLRKTQKNMLLREPFDIVWQGDSGTGKTTNIINSAIETHTPHQLFGPQKYGDEKKNLWSEFSQSPSWPENPGSLGWLKDPNPEILHGGLQGSVFQYGKGTVLILDEFLNSINEAPSEVSASIGQDKGKATTVAIDSANLKLENHLSTAVTGNGELAPSEGLTRRFRKTQYSKTRDSQKRAIIRQLLEKHLKDKTLSREQIEKYAAVISFMLTQDPTSGATYIKDVTAKLPEMIKETPSIADVKEKIFDEATPYRSTKKEAPRRKLTEAERNEQRESMKAKIEEFKTKNPETAKQATTSIRKMVANFKSKKSNEN